MTSPGLRPGARPVAAACFRQTRRRLASVRQQERQLAALRGFRREVAARTCEQQRRDTRVPLQARDSHPVADGPWCTGTAQVTDADTTARPHITHNHGVRMSRYSVPTQHPGLTVIVGWDNPLATFFAQVFNPSIEEDAEACLLWCGTAPEGIPTVAALQAQLADWATIPPDIVDRLTRDQQAATPPTPLQRWAHQLLYGTGEPRADRA